VALFSLSWAGRGAFAAARETEEKGEGGDKEEPVVAASSCSKGKDGGKRRHVNMESDGEEEVTAGANTESDKRVRSKRSKTK